MPELPEVETVVRGLSKYIIGQKIKDAQILNAKSFLWNPKITKPNVLFGLTVHSLSRRGKAIIIELAKPGVAKSEDGLNSLSLLIHLKMTGQLIYIPTARRRPKGYGGLRRLNLGHPTNDFSQDMPARQTRVIFELSKGALYFNDQRKFGWVKLLPTKDIKKDSFIERLGVEPFSKSFTPDILWQAIQKHPNSPIKSTLMDQSLIAGVGNIYSDEALFLAHIRPDRKGKTIVQIENKKLFSAIKKVLKLGIKHSGTSIANYKNADGLPGKMQNYLNVYNKKGLTCPKKCGAIKTIRLGGRSAHFCPICQK